MTSVRRWAATATAAAWMILIVTGVWLTFGYQPIAPAGSSTDGSLATGNSLSSFAQDLHLFAGVLAVALSFVVGVLSLREQDWSGRGAIIVAVAGVAAIFAIGRLLPWDALALIAVDLDTDTRGYLPLLSDDVRFVIFETDADTFEVSPTTVVLWLGLHVLVLPGLVAASLRAILRNRREHRLRLARSDP